MPELRARYCCEPAPEHCATAAPSPPTPVRRRRPRSAPRTPRAEEPVEPGAVEYRLQRSPYQDASGFQNLFVDDLAGSGDISSSRGPSFFEPKLPKGVSVQRKLHHMVDVLREDDRRRMDELTTKIYACDRCRCVQAAEVEEKEMHLGEAQRHLEVVLHKSEDPQYLHHVLTTVVGPKLFYDLPLLTSRFMRKIALHKECMEEFGSRSEFEERATAYHFANALAILKACNERQAAEEMFQEATSLQWQGKQAISWHCLEQTPAVHIDGLEHRKFWDPPPELAHVLEENVENVRTDLLEMQSSWRSQIPAYPNLVETSQGVWDMLQLYSSRRWNLEACDLMPRTAELLQKYLPTANLPYIHYNTEEVVLFLLTPGSKVRLHNGGSNAPINLSLGLTGSNGAFLEVSGEVRPFQDGKVLAFDDGSDHRVWHDGLEDRWVLVVRMMHPQLATEPYRFFSRAWTRRSCFETWDEERHQQLTQLTNGPAKKECPECLACRAKRALAKAQLSSPSSATIQAQKLAWMLQGWSAEAKLTRPHRRQR
eukprot:symbB.v1.2.016784.t2/scaffold1290.1/size126440/5